MGCWLQGLELHGKARWLQGLLCVDGCLWGLLWRGLRRMGLRQLGLDWRGHRLLGWRMLGCRLRGLRMLKY